MMPEDLNSLAANYGLDPSAALLSYPGSQLFPTQVAPAAVAAPVQAAPEAPAPVAPTALAVPAGQLPVAGLAGINPELTALLSRYFPAGNEYEAELKTARQAANQESQAFYDLIKGAMKSPQESGPDKAEMYFRLAAACGAPTKTGNFMESLGTAGGAASEMLKERRAAQQTARMQNLQLGLEAQKMRMQGAKED